MRLSALMIVNQSPHAPSEPKTMLSSRHGGTLCVALTLAVTGCWSRRQEFRFPERQIGAYQDFATQIEYPDVDSTLDSAVTGANPPRTVDNPSDQSVRNLPLAEAMQLAMSNSNIIRNLGGSVVASPAGTSTMFDPALRESDPRASVAAALSAFDAQLSSSIFWNRIDRGINQTFSGLFLPRLQQLQSAFQMEVAKTTATGARFSLRQHINYDRSITRNPSLRFDSVYQLDYEAEYRQPLLQGAGVEFNRIAGPNSTAGGAAGVLLARINTDVSLADFEMAVTNLVSDVEIAYWELYFAYRDLDAKLAGRDSSLERWRETAERLRVGVDQGAPENEARTRSQYYSFQAAVENAISMLYEREERLRYILGMPANGPALIRPATEPSTAKIVFDWYAVLDESYMRRVELRRQKWQIKRRELELLAAHNYIKPRLDAVALYRWRGLGNHLIDSPGPTGFESAYQNLTKGNFQEWQMGLQLNVPIGFRREFTALRNAELQLARERALLKEQEFRISHDLSSAIRSLQRSFQLMKTNLNRRVAAHYEVRALSARRKVGFVYLYVLLEAEQRLADADSAYYRALVDYMLAIKDIHRAKGSLLEYDGIALAEGPWSTDAYCEALDRSRHFTPHPIDYGIHQPRPVSRGPYGQETGGGFDPSGIPLDQPVEPVEILPAPAPQPQTPAIELAPAADAPQDPHRLPTIEPEP